MRAPTPAELAHLRLSSSLPSTTHKRQDPDPRDTSYVGRPRYAATKILHARILKLKAQGLTDQEIADECDVTKTTVRNHLKAKR